MRLYLFLLLTILSGVAVATEPNKKDLDAQKQLQIEINMEFMENLIPTPYAWDEGPTYRYEYLEGRELEIIWAARAELELLEASEVAFLRASIKRAVLKLNEAGLKQISVEVMNTLSHIPRPRTAAGSEVEVVHLQFFETKTKEVFAIARKESDSKKKAILDEAVFLLQRASLFYARLGRTKADACLIQQLYCRVNQGCFTECEILAAQRIRDTTCAIHGEYLISWFPPLKEATERWSTERAAALSGTNDMDAEACTKWLHAMKPIFIEKCGEEWTKKIYENPSLRTGMWLICARSMRCTALNYMGTTPPLSRTETDEALSSLPLVKENYDALQKYMHVLSIQCCNQVVASVTTEVILEAKPEIVPLHVAPDCGCGGTPQQTIVLPRWCK